MKKTFIVVCIIALLVGVSGGVFAKTKVKQIGPNDPAPIAAQKSEKSYGAENAAKN